MALEVRSYTHVVMLCYFILCHVMLRYIILCYVTLCYAILCYILFCSVFSSQPLSSEVISNNPSLLNCFLAVKADGNWETLEFGKSKVSGEYIVEEEPDDTRPNGVTR